MLYALLIMELGLAIVTLSCAVFAEPFLPYTSLCLLKLHLGLISFTLYLPLYACSALYAAVSSKYPEQVFFL